MCISVNVGASNAKQKLQNIKIKMAYLCANILTVSSNISAGIETWLTLG